MLPINILLIGSPMAQRNQPDRRFRSTREASQILGIGIQQVYGAIERGEIKAVRLGGQFRIPDREIERLERGQKGEE
jgi:excisionase family DNA binding protein